MKIKKLSLILGLTAIMTVTACGSSKYSDAPTASYSESAAMDNGSYYADDAMYSYAEEAPASMVDTKTTENATTSNRKLIKRVNLSVETKEYDSFLVNIESKINELGGYVENMDVYNGSNYHGGRSSRYANITARIPAKNLTSFVSTVGEQSNVTNRSESVEDVTLSYVDMDSHKRMLETERDRLLDLLEQCETIEDIITVEERLTDIRYQIDSMESQLRTYDNLVDYSTLYLNISEVIDFTIVDTPEKTTWERISEGFTESLNDVMYSIKEFFIWFIVNLPRLIMFVVIVTIIIFILKCLLNLNGKYREMKAERKAKKLAKKQAKKEAKLAKESSNKTSSEVIDNTDKNN